MSNPSETALSKAAGNESLTADDAYALCQLPPSALEELCAIASALRDQRSPHVLTYSPKVFLPVTNLCRDRCTYCTFRRDPGDRGEWTMTVDEVADWSERGQALGCIEALMCLGDKPEIAFRGFKKVLAEHGVSSTAQYVARCCEVALEQGLMPHTNAGLLSREEMEMLRPLNVSMGLMLENVSPRMRDRGMPHQYAPDKDPGPRVQMIAEAGELNIAFTSGILCGIGENEAERVASLLALRDLHARYGHIQEVIVQNFRAKDATPMAGAIEISDDEMVRTVAMARLILGPQMNLQAPPNLSPGAHHRLIHAGINDWGGISPLTLDYVNPEAEWPAVESLRETCRAEGFELEARLPTYPEFMNDTFVDPVLLERLQGATPPLSNAGATAP